VRRPEQLDEIDALIIPGGESTTIGKLAAHYGIIPKLKERAAAGMPVWGTCAGAIFIATDVPGHPHPLAGLMDMTVERNAFGRQVDSFEADLDVGPLGPEPFHAVFIRAPKITRVGPGVEVLARLGDGGARSRGAKRPSSRHGRARSSRRASTPSSRTTRGSTATSSRSGSASARAPGHADGPPPGVRAPLGLAPRLGVAHGVRAPRASCGGRRRDVAPTPAGAARPAGAPARVHRGLPGAAALHRARVRRAPSGVGRPHARRAQRAGRGRQRVPPPLGRQRRRRARRDPPALRRRARRGPRPRDLLPGRLLLVHARPGTSRRSRRSPRRRARSPRGARPAATRTTSSASTS